MDTRNLIHRIDELIKYGEKALATQYSSPHLGTLVNSGLYHGFRSTSLSFIALVYGCEHPYYREFDQTAKRSNPTSVNSGIGILKAIREEIAGGWLISAKGLIAAEIFTDFLEMAEYLLSEGYKDPAAVVAGSVLEEHLRQLCSKHGIDIQTTNSSGNTRPKKADTLNADLAKAQVYSDLDQKQVTAWLDLRNKAAHGRYSEYTHDQVEIMINGIIDFLARKSL